MKVIIASLSFVGVVGILFQNCSKQEDGVIADNLRVSYQGNEVFLELSTKQKKGLVEENAIEKFKLSSTPVFIENQTETTDTKASSKLSKSFPLSLPIALHEPVFGDEEFFDDLGVKWVRLSGPVGFVWDVDSPKQLGVYDWSRMDKVISKFGKNKIQFLATIYTFNHIDQETGEITPHQHIGAKAPKNLEFYRDYLKQVVQRYKNSIKYWQINNEVDGSEWKDTPENYGKLLNFSAQVIKEEDPSAKIVIAGMADPRNFEKFFSPVLEELSRLESSDSESSKLIDGFDFHWSLEVVGDTYKHVKTFELEKLIKKIRKKLDSLGYFQVALFESEFSSYAGSPYFISINSEGKEEKYFLTKKTELEQANDLIKGYVMALGAGVSRVFWAMGVRDRYQFAGLDTDNYWDMVGLAYNPLRHGKNQKKKSYYALKTIIEKLNSSTQVSRLGNGKKINGKEIYIYRFGQSEEKIEKKIFVAWAE